MQNSSIIDAPLGFKNGSHSSGEFKTFINLFKANPFHYLKLQWIKHTEDTDNGFHGRCFSDFVVGFRKVLSRYVFFLDFYSLAHVSESFLNTRQLSVAFDREKPIIRFALLIRSLLGSIWKETLD